jgi:C4-dicarboxylate transporter DctQ subunit
MPSIYKGNSRQKRKFLCNQVVKLDPMRRTKVEIIFDRVLKAGASLAAFLLIFIMLSICVELVCRRMGHPLMWVMEVTEYSLLYITFLGTAWVLEREGHVKMDIVVNALKTKIQALLGIITSVIGSVMSLYLVLYGIRVTWDYFERDVVECTPLLTPTFIILLIIPLGSIPLLIQFLRRAFGYLVIWKASSSGKTHEPIPHKPRNDD